ncbi:MAG: peptidase M1, partial [Bacteroidetes bacterium]
TIFYDENTIKGDRKTESLLAHEIAHQWFGNSASETHFSHLWLSEGFATYMTDAYLESHYGTDTLKSELKAQRKQVFSYEQKRYAPIIDTSTTNYMIMLNPNSYEKGGWVLHMLRGKLGDSIFWKGIRTYYGKFAGKNASTEDLQKVFESVSGQNLGQYFRQWLYQPGHPQLKITWTYNNQSKSIQLNIQQTQKSDFEFPLELGIINGSQNEIKTIQVKEKNSSIQIPVSAKPERIILDPNTNLLAEGTIDEKP